MAYNSDTECIICFEKCASDDNYMNTRIVNDVSGNVNVNVNVNVNTDICNCNYNLHQACYLEYIKKFGMTCMVCKKNYVPYKYILQQNMNNVYVGARVDSGAWLGAGAGDGARVGAGADVGSDVGDVGARGALERVHNNTVYSQSECQRIISFFICFFICLFICISMYILHLLFLS